jgi:hypothetical protein
LRLIARQAVDALEHGAHLARRFGESAEFVDYKDYVPGDDARAIDWRVFARSDRLVLRRHAAERQLPVTIVIDASADAGTGPELRASPLEGRRTKLGFGVCLAATLAVFLSRLGEPVGLRVLAGADLPWRVLAPRRGRAHLHRLLAVLAAVRPEGKADLPAALAALGRSGRRRSTTFLISDLMEPAGGYAQSMRAFGCRIGDLRVAHLFDPDELDLRIGPAAQLYSPEGGAPIALDPVAARAVFREVVIDYLGETRAAVLSARGHYVAAPCDGSLGSVMTALLSGAGTKTGATSRSSA